MAFPTDKTNAVDGVTTASASQLNAIETKIGIDDSADTNSLDYKINHITIPDVPVKATGAEINTGTDDAKFATPKAIADSNIAFNGDLTNFQYLYLPEGVMYNGKIVPSVASNNLKVALKGMDGNDPSATNPVYIRINGVLRSITSALSLSLAAGTNWFGCGSAELATKETDIFAFIWYSTTDGAMDIAASRYPDGRKLSDFELADATNSKVLIKNRSGVTTTDQVCLVARFAATLSAGAGYTWTVPTFTATNLVQEPIYKTRWLGYVLNTTGFTGTPTVAFARYMIDGSRVFINCNVSGTSNATTMTISIPFAHSSAGAGYDTTSTVMDNGSFLAAPGLVEYLASDTKVNIYKNTAFASFTNSGTKAVITRMNYEI